jgi:hypothetical protein
MYIDILLHLREAVRKERPEKWRTNNWFLFHYNAPAHQSALVKDFLAKKTVTTLEPLLYSPDLTSADFYLLPGKKSALKLRCFVMLEPSSKCDGRAEKAVTKWLPGMFPTPLQLDNGRKLIVAQGVVLKRNVA